MWSWAYTQLHTVHKGNKSFRETEGKVFQKGLWNHEWVNEGGTCAVIYCWQHHKWSESATCSGCHQIKVRFSILTPKKTYRRIASIHRSSFLKHWWKFGQLLECGLWLWVFINCHHFFPWVIVEEIKLLLTFFLTNDTAECKEREEWSQAKVADKGKKGRCNTCSNRGYCINSNISCPHNLSLKIWF